MIAELEKVQLQRSNDLLKGVSVLQRLRCKRRRCRLQNEIFPT